MDSEMKTVEIPADKLLDALLHMKQLEHHYATQESVDNLKESVRELKSDTNKRLDDMKSDTNKRLDDMKSDTAKQFDDMKSDNAIQFDALREEIRNTNRNTFKMLWFIVAICLTTVFKEQIFSIFS